MKKSLPLFSWLFSQHHSSPSIFGKQIFNRVLLRLFIIVFFIAFAGKSWGQTAGPINPATGVDLAGVGTVTWTTPGNIISDNNIYASAVCGASATSHYLRASNFGFAIPVGSIIIGITVDIGRYSSGGSNPRIRDNIVQLVNGSGAIVGSNYANAGTNWPNVEAIATYGGAADTWAAGLTDSDINDPDFGVVLSVRNAHTTNNRTAYVDYFRITVTYTAPCVSPSITADPSNTSYCAGGTANFSITATGSSISYQWQYWNGVSWGSVSNGTPTGATYTNANSATMTVAGITAAGSYNYQCYVSNSCGNATSNAATLTVNPTPTVAAIGDGAPTVCVGASTPAFTNATAGGTWSITAGTGTASITTGGVVTGTAIGSVTVVYTVTSGGCSNSATSALIVTALGIAQPSVITGNATPCPGTSQVYSVTNVAGVTYTWTFPVGWTQTAGGTTNSVTVTVGTGSGDITVTPSNSCGSGTPRTLAVTIGKTYRSVATGNWTALSSWEMSTDGGGTWEAATSYPTSGDCEALIQNTHTITLNATVSAPNTTVEVGGILSCPDVASCTLTYGTNFTLTNNGTINIDGGGATSDGGSWNGRGLIIDGTLINNGSINISDLGVLRIANSVDGAIVTNNLTGTITSSGGMQYWDKTAGSTTDYYFGIDANVTYNSVFTNYGTVINIGTDATATGYYRGHVRLKDFYNYGTFSNGQTDQKRANATTNGEFVNYLNATINNNGNFSITGGTSKTFLNDGTYNENWATSFNQQITITNSSTGIFNILYNGCIRLKISLSEFINNGIVSNSNSSTPGDWQGISLSSGTTFTNNNIVIDNGPILNNGTFKNNTSSQFIYQTTSGSFSSSSGTNYLRYFGNALLKYNGSITQTTSNYEFSTDVNYSPAYIEIDNSSGNSNGVTLHAARTIYNKTANLPTNGEPYLILTNGALNLNQKTLTISSPSSSAISRTNGFIVSEHKVAASTSILKWNIGTATGSYVFPFGTNDASDNYIPLTFNKTSAGAADISISTRATATSNNTPLSGASNVAAVSNLSHNGTDISVSSVIDRWWDIRPSVAGVTGNVTFTYRGAENTTSDPTSEIAVQHWTGALWNDGNGGGSMTYFPTGVNGVTSGTSSVTAAGLTQFSPYVLVLKNNPLPVELLIMTAKCSNAVVDISWSTATETNNDYFTVQRSADAVNWEFVKSIPGAGNSNSTQFYSATDKNPLSGTSYYRLRQTDFDGQTETFSAVAVSCNDEGSDPKVSYSPNPFTSELWVDFQNLDFKKATMTLFDVQGNMVFQKIILYDDFPNKKLKINLSDLASGIYMVSFASEEYAETTRIVKK